MPPEPLRPASGRPERPDGVRYEFNCCAAPEVWEHEDGSRLCLACGHDWTEALGG